MPYPLLLNMGVYTIGIELQKRYIVPIKNKA
jgi:hypothetical protein